MMLNPVPGERIELTKTLDKDMQRRVGTAGTVKWIDDLGTVHVEWDDGGTLGLLPDFDEWMVL